VLGQNISDRERQFIIKRCEKLGKPVPEEYRDVKLKRQDILNAFFFLSQRRTDDYQPITDSAIMGYVCYYGSLRLHPNDFLGLIQRLDSFYLSEKSKKAKADFEAEKMKRRR